MAKTNRNIELVDRLAAIGKGAFSNNEIEVLADLSPQAASNVLNRLVRDGLVDRVARGRYVLRPLGSLGTRAASEDLALAVGAAFQGKKHRIAYRSALDHHGLLQHPSRHIIVAMDSGLSLSEVSGRPLRVVVETPERLEIGAVDAGHGARVSSVERALLESATRPELVGGIATVATALAGARINGEVLQRLAQDLRARPALHRLGSLSEVLGLETDVKRIEPLGGWGRLIRLDPDVEEVEEDDVWRHDKWGVEWPFSVEELEETVRR